MPSMCRYGGIVETPNSSLNSVEDQIKAANVGKLIAKVADVQQRIPSMNESQ